MEAGGLAHVDGEVVTVAELVV
eukprot:COSAG04_NODE_25073_length_312_cov_0.962441_1_plen_21_part_10